MHRNVLQDHKYTFAYICMYLYIHICTYIARSTTNPKASAAEDLSPGDIAELMLRTTSAALQTQVHVPEALELTTRSASQQESEKFKKNTPPSSPPLPPPPTTAAPPPLPEVECEAQEKGEPPERIGADESTGIDIQLARTGPDPISTREVPPGGVNVHCGTSQAVTITGGKLEHEAYDNVGAAEASDERVRATQMLGFNGDGGFGGDQESADESFSSGVKIIPAQWLSHTAFQEIQTIAHKAAAWEGGSDAQVPESKTETEELGITTKRNSLPDLSAITSADPSRLSDMFVEPIVQSTFDSKSDSGAVMEEGEQSGSKDSDLPMLRKEIWDAARVVVVAESDVDELQRERSPVMLDAGKWKRSPGDRKVANRREAREGLGLVANGRKRPEDVWVSGPFDHLSTIFPQRVALISKLNFLGNREADIVRRYTSSAS